MQGSDGGEEKGMLVGLSDAFRALRLLVQQVSCINGHDRGVHHRNYWIAFEGSLQAMLSSHMSHVRFVRNLHQS